jgi:hypothetical protein
VGRAVLQADLRCCLDARQGPLLELPGAVADVAALDELLLDLEAGVWLAVGLPELHLPPPSWWALSWPREQGPAVDGRLGRAVELPPQPGAVPGQDGDSAEPGQKNHARVFGHAFKCRKGGKFKNYKIRAQ